MRQTSGGATTNYAIDLAGGLTQVLADGTNVYLYGNGRIAQYQGTQAEYFLGDALGSVRQLADGNGNVTLVKRYEPYGELLDGAGSGATSYGFANEWTDGTGLIYLRARYYAPYLNQFIQPDPIVPNPYQPWEWNRYTYVRNNPTRYIDPTGRICLDPWAPSGFHLDPNRECDYPEGSTGALFWRRDPLGEDTAMIEMPWVDEMDQNMWNQYPNSCGAAALYMFLKGERVPVNFENLIHQLRKERPGGYDGYCCSDGWERFPTPTPDSEGWCNQACVSGEVLAKVARTYYGLNIESGDNWTHKKAFQKVSNGHPVLALIRAEMGRTRRHFGHFVVIRGFIDRGWTVVFNDSYPGEAYWNATSEVRRQVGENRAADWGDFDASWASAVDEMDPLFSGGHVRWAMTVR